MVGTVFWKETTEWECISVVSHCVCSTNISNCIGALAGDLLHPLTEIQMCNLSISFL